MEKPKTSAVVTAALMAMGCAQHENSDHRHAAYLMALNGRPAPLYMDDQVPENGILEPAPDSSFVEVVDDLSQPEVSNDVRDRVRALFNSEMSGGVLAGYDVDTDSLHAYVDKVVYQGESDGRVGEYTLVCEPGNANGLSITATASYFEDGRRMTGVSGYDDSIAEYGYGSFGDWEHAPDLHYDLSDPESATSWLGKVTYDGVVQECAYLASANRDFWPR